MDANRIIKNVRILADAGFSEEKIARIVYGDAHPMCVELIELDIEDIRRSAVAHFLDDLFNYQDQMERTSFIGACQRLVPDEDESTEWVDELDELIELCILEDVECIDCGKCNQL